MGDALWYEGMAPFNVEVFQASENDPVKLDNMLSRERAKILGLKPDDGEFDPGFTDGDREVMLLRSKTWIDRSHRAGLREGIAGWREDIVGMADWGFDPRAIDVPTLVWGAGNDVFTPPQHYKWLADNIGTAELHTEAHASHTRAMEVLPGVVGWCINGEYLPPVSVY
jgi:pimeloyl-ACP methyl ester carboxylesterase